MCIPKFILNDGNQIPAVGYGTALIRGAKAVRLIRQAIESGYQLIDSAYNYENEGAVGEAIRQSAVAREKLFVTSKLPGRFHQYFQAIETIQESLYRAGLDYYDLYLIHWPNLSEGKYLEAWQALIDAQRFGLIRSIGVSNFTKKQLLELENETGILPAINQIELHPGFSQAELREFHKEKGILTEAWSPLSQGNDMLQQPLLLNLAEKYQKNVAQIILRWAYQLNVLPIPRSANIQRQISNLAIFDFALSLEELQEIERLDSPEYQLGPNPDTHIEM